MTSFLTKYIFSTLVLESTKLQSPKFIERKVHLDLKNISSENRIKIHKLRYRKTKQEKIQEIYFNLKQLEHITKIKEKQHLLSPEKAILYKQQISKMLEILNKKTIKPLN